MNQTSLVNVQIFIFLDGFYQKDGQRLWIFRQNTDKWGYLRRPL